MYVASQLASAWFGGMKEQAHRFHEINSFLETGVKTRCIFCLASFMQILRTSHFHFLFRPSHKTIPKIFFSVFH